MLRPMLFAFVLCVLSVKGHGQPELTAYGERQAIENEEFVFTRHPTQESFECAAIEVRPGRLIAVWLGGSEPGADDIRVFSAHQERDTWASPKEIASGDGTRCWYPSLAKLDNGEVLCFYRVGADPSATKAFVVRSKDSGITWSQPERLASNANGPEHPMVLTTEKGALVYGVTGGWGLVPAAWTEVSTDRAKTWDLQTSIPPAKPGMYLVAPILFYGLDHTLRAVVSDSSLTVFCLSESVDGGDSWSPAVPITLPNLGKGIGMATLEDGRLMAVYNDARTAKQKRSKMHQVALAVSSNDGKNWYKSMLLETGHGEYGSPVVIQTKDGAVHVFYNWKRKNIKHLVINAHMISAGQRG